MQSVLVATAPSSGFTYTPSCDAHHAPATFAVEFDDLDGEGRREVFCALCLGSGVDYAMNRSWFTPPTISRITPPLTWRCARCGEDPATCPVVDGRCVRGEQVAA